MKKCGKIGGAFESSIFQNFEIKLQYFKIKIISKFLGNPVGPPNKNCRLRGHQIYNPCITITAIIAIKIPT
jgi:hypothetical protein